MVSFGFFNSSNGDRKYSADDVSRIFSYLITDGVLMTYGDKFFTTPATANLGVVLGTGWAWFNHTWTQSDTAIPFELDEPDPSLDRFDTVYLKVDRRSLGRMNSLGVVKGTAAINPVVPTFPMETDVFYHPLAYVKVRHGVTRIAASDIEILVGKTQAPFITSILQTTDITTLFQGWSEQFGTKMTTWQSGYDAKMTEWENEVDTLETSLTANVNAVIASANQQLQTQQTQFTNQMASQQTTFTNSLNGWETDFQTWFDNLQTYLSQDVVTEIWADLDDLKTRMVSAETTNTNQSTAISALQSGKLDISAKATTAQVDSNTSGNIWVDPSQVARSISNKYNSSNISLPQNIGQYSYKKGSNISIETTNAISLIWGNGSVSNSGVIACPIGVSSLFLGWFVNQNTFMFFMCSNNYNGVVHSVGLETGSYTSGTVKARFIPQSEGYGYLALQYRNSSGSNIVKLYYIGNDNYMACPEVAQSSVGDIETWKICGVMQYFLIINIDGLSSSGFNVVYIYASNKQTLPQTTHSSVNVSGYSVPNSLTMIQSNRGVVIPFYKTSTSLRLVRLVCSGSGSSLMISSETYTDKSSSTGFSYGNFSAITMGYSSSEFLMYCYNGGNYQLFGGSSSECSLLTSGTLPSPYTPAYLRFIPNNYWVDFYSKKIGVASVSGHLYNLPHKPMFLLTSSNVGTDQDVISSLSRAYSSDSFFLNTVAGEVKSAILYGPNPSCVGGFMYSSLYYGLFQIGDGVITFCSSKSHARKIVQTK